MAYTPLTTQVAGGTASAAGWANVVKANFEAMGPHLLVRKTSDESDSVGTLQNEDQLIPPTINANEVWWFQYILFIQRTTNANVKLGFTFPSGNIGALFHHITGHGALAGTASPVSATFSNAVNLTAPGQPFPLDVIYTCGGTGGTLQLQWAMDTSGTMTVKTNSTLWGVKLA